MVPSREPFAPVGVLRSVQQELVHERPQSAILGWHFPSCKHGERIRAQVGQGLRTSGKGIHDSVKLQEQMMKNANVHVLQKSLSSLLLRLYFGRIHTCTRRRAAAKGVAQFMKTFIKVGGLINLRAFSEVSLE